jgi:glycine/D-amino acid oxidase-like deaminating enzyme
MHEFDAKSQVVICADHMHEFDLAAPTCADDAIVDSTAYAQGLIRHALSTGAVRIRDMCPRVVSVESERERAVVKLEDGTTLYARQALVCTGECAVS